MDAAAVLDTVKTAMQQQQSSLLELAASNALKLTREEAQRSRHDLLEKIDDSITKSAEHEGHVWIFWIFWIVW